MQRSGWILFLGVGVVLTTWVIAPAAPSPGRAPVSAAELAAFDQSAPALAEMNAQAERLRDRLATPPQFPVPERDPFRFGRRPEPAPPKVEAPPVAALVEPTVAPPTLPRLIAVMTSETDGVIVRTAVLAVGDDVQLVKVGDSASVFTVRSVGADVVELVDTASGATFRISLR